MSNNEQRILATERYYDRDTSNNEQNSGVVISSGVPESGLHAHEWADVLRDLEPYY